MTNLEWIRTLSAKELSDLLYDYWLPRGQYVWTDSRKGLVKMLCETYLERDCDKCKHQGNCYCVKGLGCPFDPKTKPSNSEKPNICEICKHWEYDAKYKWWHCPLQDNGIYECHYEPRKLTAVEDEPTISKMEQVDKDINVRSKDEPQTYVINPQDPTNDDKCFECDDFFTCGGQCNKVEDEPQTDFAWK